MITKLIVKNLNGKFDFNFDFYPDINIFTGKNGCGKTTVLKLIWYLTSGNIKQLFREISFEYVYFKSDNTEVEFTVKKDEEVNLRIISGFYKKEGYSIDFSEQYIGELDVPFSESLFSDRSLFFPTFRRIEGGFGIKEDYIIQGNQRLYLEGGNSLNSALKFIANNISVSNNKFIASISTIDIISLLNKKYTEVLEKTSKLEKEQSIEILNKTKNNKKDVGLLKEIEELVKNTDAEKNILMKPFTVLSDLIKEIFYDKSIKITKSLTLGETRNAIISDKLSAGEKQMLGFLCYNFFSDNTSIFIDEPELSLHTDWQRILFPTLLEQSTENQFFVATHSPFIYTQFLDKEHILDIDKGEKK